MIESKQVKSDQIQIDDRNGQGRSSGRPQGSKNKNKQLTKEKILRDLQFIYHKSVRAGNWTNAITAKVWQGKFLGIARTRKLPDITKLSDMNPEQLREFVEILKENDSEVRDSLEQ